MVRKILIPLIAVVGVLFAVWRMLETNKPVMAAQPVVEPARSEFANRISGAGLIEASTQNIAIGTLIAGVVSDVHVVVGAKVKKGDPLFKIDDRDRRADLAVRQAQLQASKARLQRLREQPRAEDIPPAEARVREAQAALTDSENLLRLATQLTDKRAIAEEEVERRRMSVEANRARHEQAEANLALLKAGAWKADVLVAGAELEQVDAVVKQMETDLDRLTVRAPVDGEVLQVNIRVGEYAPTGVLATPLMILGGTDTLHVRVDLDENDAWRFKSDAPAVAFVRGNRELSTPLRYVRTEPFVVPKRSLTGDSRERVDTRVLQVLYAFDRAALPVFVGQQMDVFVEAAPAGILHDNGGASSAPTAKEKGQ